MKFWLTVCLFSLGIGAQAETQARCTLGVVVNEAISASTLDYLERAEQKAVEQKCDSLLVRINTPGGNLQTTHLIVERILASPLPYLCLITPQGGRAGSAGAIILQACHVNGGLATTNIGAATPILGSGGEMPEDLRKKMINDTVSWLTGVTQLRKRNLEFSKEIVTEAKSLSSEEAVKIGALDTLAENESDFLQFAAGRVVVVQDTKEHPVMTGAVVEFQPDLRHKILSFVADPEFAYMLFMGSLALLYVEITHPGMVAPGVIGGIGLILSLVAFHKMAVSWGGLALILLGVGFLIAEMFVASFGILGIGGLVAVFVGSVFLFNFEATGYSLPLTLIFSVVGILAALLLGVGYMAVKTLGLKTQDLDADLKARSGEVLTSEGGGHRGQIEIMGETWSYVSEDSLQPGDQVTVTDRQGLILNVKKIKSREE